MAATLFLTFNDAPSGIYAGQVIDVCRYVNAHTPAKLRLVAFLSVRGFWAGRRKIKAQLPDALVLPMVPKAKNWKLNGFTFNLVCRFTRAKACMARGPFATALALRAREKGILQNVIFDGRGAYIAELTEYNVIPDEAVKHEIASVERRCVLESNRQLAVSKALVDYWHETFGYNGNTHRVIPCTLNSNTLFTPVSDEAVRQARQKLGIPANATVVVYSGSVAGWQSLDDFGARMLPLMQQHENLHLLLLVKSLPEHFAPLAQHAARIHRHWLAPEEVGTALAAADLGWMLREDSVTNRVASPVKFAEYLAAGLHVIISSNLGDTTAFVLQHGCGIVCNGENIPAPQPLSLAQRQKAQQLAQTYFLKTRFADAYADLLK
ncbi:MAG: hypothetical protein IM638_19485 [Bacteroidetes bacterium]|nr:hypothetical protein [Bacteroidota bacterium]